MICQLRYARASVRRLRRWSLCYGVNYRTLSPEDCAMKILPILTARSNTAHTAYPARMAHGDVSVPARLARDACRTKAFRSYYFELVEPATGGRSLVCFRVVRLWTQSCFSKTKWKKPNERKTNRVSVLESEKRSRKTFTIVSGQPLCWIRRKIFHSKNLFELAKYLFVNLSKNILRKSYSHQKKKNVVCKLYDLNLVYPKKINRSKIFDLVNHW